MGARRLPNIDAPRTPSLNDVGVVAALASEARALGRRDGLVLSVSGIGCAAAGAAARALVEARVSALMTFGLAGGLDPKLAAGSVILPSHLLAPDGTRLAASKVWRERVAAALRSSREIIEGTVLTSSVALKTPEEKTAAFRDTGAVAVDMESFAVAEVAANNKLEFIAVRVIVDTAADTVPSSVAAASRAGRVQIGRLLAGLVVAPGDIASLLRLALRYRTAMRALKAIGGYIA
jgi:adenosylhomocysteine nucleosidase